MSDCGELDRPHTLECLVELPNLEGQPGWVIVVVFFLFIAGGLGTLYLKRRLGQGPEDDAPQVEGRPDTVSVPAGAEPFALVRESMGLLATQAAKSAEDADRAEQEAKELARQLAECERAMAVLREQHIQLAAQLEACRQDAYRRSQETGR